MRFIFATLIVGLIASFAVSQEIVDNVVVVLDDSGSMAERMRSDRKTDKMEAAKSALIKVIDQLPANAHVGILLLNDGWLCQLGPVDKAEITSRIQQIRDGGGTPLGRSMKAGADALLAKRDKEHYGSYRLLVVTDGEANDSRKVEQYLPDILARGITVDVIGVDMASAHSLATKVQNYRKADDPASLETAIQQVFAETADGSDTSEEDFELAAAFPDDMAMEVITSLTDSGNHPIGETPKVVVQDDGTVDIQPAPANKESGSGFGLFAIIALAILIGVLFFAVVGSQMR
jgi:hypothetical protein